MSHHIYLYITRIPGPGDFGHGPVYPLGAGGSWASSAVVLGGPWHPLPSFCMVAGDFVAHVVSFDVFWWLRVPSGPSKTIKNVVLSSIFKGSPNR